MRYLSNSIYSEIKVEIPTPEFFVFYNGPKDAPLEQDLKLSDAFSGEYDKINLELVVHVINVNLEKGAELLEKCRTLKEYSLFISKVREKYLIYKNRDIAIAEAIDECIRECILADYLKNHKGDVMSFLRVQLSQEERDAIREQDAEIRKAREIAAKLKKMELSIEQIIEATGLTKEEIEKL